MNHSRRGRRPMLALTCLPLLVLSAACASTGSSGEPREEALRVSAVPVNASAPAPEPMLARSTEPTADEVPAFEANVRIRANRRFDVIIEPSVIENEQLLITLAPSGMMMPYPLGEATWGHDDGVAVVRFPPGQLQWVEIPLTLEPIEFDDDMHAELELGTYTANATRVDVTASKYDDTTTTALDDPFQAGATASTGDPEAWLQQDGSDWKLHVRVAGRETVLRVGYTPEP